MTTAKTAAANNKRVDILRAALQLFSERGFSGTTVPEIAVQAKVGAGTIYRYFASKDELVNVLFQECMRDLAEALKLDEGQAAAAVRDRFRYFVTSMFRFALQKERVLAFIDAHSGAEVLDSESRRCFEDFLDVIRSVLDEGKAKGEIAPLPSDALIAIVYGSIVKLVHAMKSGKVETSPELIADAELCCWNAIRARQ